MFSTHSSRVRSPRLRSPRNQHDDDQHNRGDNHRLQRTYPCLHQFGWTELRQFSPDCGRFRRRAQLDAPTKNQHATWHRRDLASGRPRPAFECDHHRHTSLGQLACRHDGCRLPRGRHHDRCNTGCERLLGRANGHPHHHEGRFLALGRRHGLVQPDIPYARVESDPRRPVPRACGRHVLGPTTELHHTDNRNARDDQ